MPSQIWSDVCSRSTTCPLPKPSAWDHVHQLAACFQEADQAKHPSFWHLQIFKRTVFSSCLHWVSSFSSFSSSKVCRNDMYYLCKAQIYTVYTSLSSAPQPGRNLAALANAIDQFQSGNAAKLRWCEWRVWIFQTFASQQQGTYSNLPNLQPPETFQSRPPSQNPSIPYVPTATK